MMQFWDKVTGSRLNAASTRIVRATLLCPQIHPPTKYQSKLFIGLGDMERKVISVSRSQDQGQRSTQIQGGHKSFAWHTSLPPDKPSHQTSTKHVHSFRRYGTEGNFGLRVTGSKVASTRIFRATHPSPLRQLPTKYQPNINQKSSFV
jgi:hypothetical protein